MNYKDIEHYGASIGDGFYTKNNQSNISYGYSKNTASMTLVRSTNSGP